MRFADGARVLVDALHTKKTRFSGVPRHVVDSILRSDEKIDCLIVTHDHADHFDRKLAGALLASHKETVLVGPVHLTEADAQRQADVSGSAGNVDVGSVHIRWLKLRHEGEEYVHVANYGYAVRSGDEFFVVLGDAATDVSRQGLDALTDGCAADAVILDFPMLALRRARESLAGVNAQNIVGFHLPFERDDASRYRMSALRALPKVRQATGLPAELLLNEGDVIHVTHPGI